MARNYLHHVVDRIEVMGPESIRVVPRVEFMGAGEVTYCDPIDSPVQAIAAVPVSAPVESSEARKARRHAEFEALEASGMTRAQIADKLGKSRAWVTRVLGRKHRSAREPASTARDPAVNGEAAPSINSRSTSPTP